MRLEMGIFPVRKVAFGSRTGYRDGSLTVNAQELKEVMMAEGGFLDVRFDLAHPGESVRIVHNVDAVEPLYKVSGPSCAFPGFLGRALTAGEGRTHKLAGMCILSTTRYPGPQTGIMTFRDSIIDMSGPGALYCATSETANLVACYEPIPTASNGEHDAAIRLATLRGASCLARCTADLKPEKIEVYELGEVGPTLPRIVYVDQVMHQAVMVATYVYGKDLDDSLPTLIHPNEMLDGAVVGANYKTGQKVPTYLHCNKPVLLELYRRHGKDVNFAGVIITRGHRDNQALKERSAQYVAKLAKLLKADGAVLAHEGGGNSSVDYFLTVQALEQAGVKAVPIMYETADPGSGDFPLVYTVPEADAIVSKGLQGQSIVLPAVERVIGSPKFKPYGGTLVDTASSFEVTNADLYADEWGMELSHFTGKDY